MKSRNYLCQIITVLAALAVLTFAQVPSARAASILFVSDVQSDNNIPVVLTADGHTVTSVLNDYSSGNNPMLSGDLSAYGAVFWSATGTGMGGIHNASTFINLANYVSAGGRVFVTGYDSIASPTDSELISFLGGTGSVDVPDVPTAVISVVNSLTTGVVDIRGITPTGGYSDRDALTGLSGDTVGVVSTSGSPTQFQWTLRTLDAGEIAYVSNGASGSSSAHPSWEDISPGGAGTYNAALRNFASAAITDDLIISPQEGFNSSGTVGGPFTPPSKNYTLENIGPNSLDWTATATEIWLDVEPNSGTLNPGDFNMVEVYLNADANNLPPGDYNDTVIFTNTTSGIIQTRDVTLEVMERT